MPEISFSNETQSTVVPSAPIQSMAPEARAMMLRPSTSRSQRRIQEDVETTRRQLEASGMLKPATIINFNPVPLVQDGLIRLTVPAAEFSNENRVELEYSGRTFVGHVLTIRSPIIYASTVGSESDPDTLSDTPQLAANYILPIGIAYSFLEHYSLNAKDSAHMGGVMIFEGDKHALSAGHLERAEGNILVPEPILLPRNRRSFTVKPRNFDEATAECFAMQSAYADFRIQNAHSLWTTNDPMQQKQITDVDRLWARFALAKELISELPPWVHAKLASGAQLATVVRCPVCSKPRPFPNVYLCPDDRAPYDAFAAFTAGMPVAQQWLDILPDEQLALVAAETLRRSNRYKAAIDKAKKDAKASGADSDEK